MDVQRLFLGPALICFGRKHIAEEYGALVKVVSRDFEERVIDLV